MAASEVYTTPRVPAPTAILGNTLVVATATTLITIPAGRTWQGSVAAEASATAAAASAVISTAGTGVVPAAGNLLVVDALGAAGGLGDSNANNMANVYVSAPAGNAVTLTATIVGTGSCSANGILL